MSFVSEVAKQMGLPHKESDVVEIDIEHVSAKHGQSSMPEYMASSPQNSSTNMDIDSNRRQ